MKGSDRSLKAPSQIAEHSEHLRVYETITDQTKTKTKKIRDV